MSSKCVNILLPICQKQLNVLICLFIKLNYIIIYLAFGCVHIAYFVSNILNAFITVHRHREAVHSRNPPASRQPIGELN